MEDSSLLFPSQFSYRRAWEHAILCSHCLASTGCLDKGTKERLVQKAFPAVSDRVNHRGLLYKLRSIAVRGQVLSTVSDFSDRRQSVRLDGNISASVDVVSGVPQSSVLRPLFTTRIVGNYIVGYADDTTLYAVIPRPLSRSQVMESLNEDLSAIYSWCSKC